MKLRAVWTVVVAVAVAGAASANLLTNPGFETGTFDGWTQSGWYNGTGGDAYSGTYGGSYEVPVLRGAGEYYILDQIVPVTAGESYDASGWLRYAGTANNSEQFLEIQWINNSGIMWGFGVGSSPVSGPQAYTFTSLNALIAPAGALSADVRAVVHTTAETSGDTAWHTFDDFSFAETIPEPATIGLTGLGVVLAIYLRRRAKV